MATPQNRAEIIAQLKRAAEQGGTTVFTYHGGSQPGKARQAHIVSVDEDAGSFKMRDNSNILKTLLIERVGWVADTEGEIVENTHIIPGPPRKAEKVWSAQELENNPEYLQHSMAQHVERLQSEGWIVQITTTCISLHKKLKSGLPRKHPTYAIKFQDRSVATVWDDETQTMRTEHIGINNRQRPWRVEGGNTPGMSYGNLPAAIDNLLIRVFADSIDLQKQ